jgi:type IV pilus assembly protein PilE
MKTLRLKRILGFTVIELMIVLIIVALLLALAYPSYINYVRKAKRGEAQQLLLNWSINQEIWRSNNVEYASDTDLPPPVDADGDYVFDLVSATATAYELRATGQGDQANDKARDGTSCTILNMRSDGRKFSNNDDTVLVCWE